MLGLANASLRSSCEVHPRAQPLTLAQSTTSDGTSLRNPSTRRRTFCAPRGRCRHGSCASLCFRPRLPSSSQGSHETIASRRTLGLKTCVTSEEFVTQVRDEWREARANLARLAPCVAESNAHATARERQARHASMECSAIEPASIFRVWAFDLNTSKVSWGF